ncbi:S41 family peptidase [Sphingomonas sp. GB1N7]|uniref:S41 family peptidase n=1 Tax=Parasphingomonas caseinilytica TaxID=3096158 RepID=UPI002FC92A23
MNRRQLITALGAAAILPAAAFPPAAVSPADLAGDIAILTEALKLHPGLYRYTTPRQIEERIARLRQGFVASSSLEQRYLLLSRFLAEIRCGHSYCNFFNQKKQVAADLFDRPTRLPFHFIWIGGRMIVTADPGRFGVPAGSEILSINGQDGGALLRSLMPYARADGHNDAKRVSLLGVAGGDPIEFFDVFHGLVAARPIGGAHHIVLRGPDGVRRAIELPAIDLAQRRAPMPVRDYRGDQPVWDWKVRADNVAVLTMPGWALYDSKWDWRSWLNDRLDSLKGARGLIVDLRDNEGGQDCGDLILARLIRRTLVEPGARRLVRFRRTPADLDRYLDTWDDSFRRLGQDAVPVENGFLQLQGDHADDTIQPVGPHIDLPVVALIGPVNSSATFQFAQKARSSGRVRLFGQGTGGNQRGINGGCFFFVRLPASGIEFDLPLIGYFPPGSPPDAGIAPDMLVAPTSRDIASGRDRALDDATGWILDR